MTWRSDPEKDNSGGLAPAAVDLLVIGAGPAGLACAIEAQRAGLSARVIEKGALVNSLVGYPRGMEFFSTPELLEIGTHPFTTQRYKPLREEAIEYYRRVASSDGLDIRLYEKVLEVSGTRSAFRVTTDIGAHEARHVVLATGFFDIPNRLGVPGEELPHVSHYFREPFAYSGSRVVVIGAKNSAAKAALQCVRHGADVTMVMRGEGPSPKIKYWILPDLQNRITEGAIRSITGARVQAIEPAGVLIDGPDGREKIRADFVLALTGYRPDYALFEKLGISVGSDPMRTPVHDPETFESNRPGLYLAGTVCGGLHTSRWFIENGRHHAAVIASHVAKRTGVD